MWSLGGDVIEHPAYLIIFKPGEMLWMGDIWYNVSEITSETTLHRCYTELFRNSSHVTYIVKPFIKRLESLTILM